MSNPYAADFLNDDGSVRFSGEVDFTDQTNQPGGVPDIGQVLAQGDDAGGRLIENIGDPLSPTDHTAVAASYMTGALNALPLATVLSAGNDANSSRITGLANPSVGTDAVNRDFLFLVAGGGLTQVLGQSPDAGGHDIIDFGQLVPAAPPVVPLTTPSVQDVIDALVTIGLITQSD